MNPKKFVIPLISCLICNSLTSCQETAPSRVEHHYTYQQAPAPTSTAPTSISTANTELSAEKFMQELFQGITNEDAPKVQRLIAQNPSRAIQCRVALREGLNDGTFTGEHRRIAAALIAMIDVAL